MQEIQIKTGAENMDVVAIHQYLSEESYWAKGISFAMVSGYLQNSFCVGAFVGNKQVGFARLITDYHTFGWLADVYVLDSFRGQGISKTMMQHITSLPWAQGLRRLMLATRDAHGLYRQFGFTDLANPSSLMEITRPDIYLQHR